MNQEHQVVIIGGGFGGLHAAQCLKNAPVQVTVIDRRNFHLFQPLLYQVATGSLSPANIASPLRAILRRQTNARVLLAEATDIDVSRKRVILRDGEIAYDTLIVAAGSRHHYFGHTEWEHFAPGLKTIEDATEIRRRIFVSFEAAEREDDPMRLQQWLTFVIVGGGPTGVELAGALGEIVHDILRHEFRRLNRADVRIFLVEGDERILPSYDPTLSSKAEFYLARLGVTVVTAAMVTEVQPEAVTIRKRDKTEQIPCRTVLWAAGVQASFLGRLLSEKTGAKLDRSGRIVVEPDLTIQNHPEIFVIGDLANYPHQTGKPLPGVATVAIQQGKYVAKSIKNRLLGRKVEAFYFHDRGSMAIIGRAAAVAEFGWIRCSGFAAWLIWLFVHLMNLVEFENRLLVLIQWAWNYFTRNRAARLITGETPLRTAEHHVKAIERAAS